MIKRDRQYRVDVRNEMRGGDGQVKIEHFWEPQKEMLSSTRMFARLTLEPGSSIGFHHHNGEEEIFVVIQGVAEADDNGTKVTLAAGDTIHTGNGAGHAIRSIGAEPLILLAVISSYAAGN